jgi:hypothetical protein
MAEAIGRILSDPAMARRMGEAGVSICRDRFGAERFVRSVERVIREAVSAEGRADGRREVSEP